MIDRTTIPGLDTVPAHRREEVILRITAIRKYIDNPKDYPASTAADEIGITAVSFRRLVRAWKENADPRRFTGRATQETDPPLPPEQAAVIRQAIDELPGAIMERIAERAMEIARELTVRMPGQAAVIKHIAIGTTGRLPDVLPAAGAVLVIEHSVVDVGVVKNHGGRGMMPIATIVTRVAEPAILGIEMSLERPSVASVVAALGEAIARMRSSGEENVRPRIYAQLLKGADWDRLLVRLHSTGCDVVVHRTQEPSPPVATLRLLGRKPGGIRLKPRLSRRPFIARPANIPRGGTPVLREEAAAFLRERWISGEEAGVDVPEAILNRLRAAFPVE